MASSKGVGDKGRDGVSKVSGIQTKSTNEEVEGSSPVPYSELIFDEDTDKEIESFLKQELILEKDASQDDVLQTQHANEQTCSTAEDNHAILIKGEVDGLSEIKNCKQIETKRCEKRLEITETSPRKHAHSNDGNEKIDCDVEIVGMNSMEEMEHSEDLSESKTDEKSNLNVVPTKVKVLAAEAKPLKVPSTQTTSIGPMWDNYILAVRGIPPREAGVS
jgi:hypothetical protein